MEDARTILPGSERTAAGATLIGKTDPTSSVTVTIVLARRTALPAATLQRAHASPASRPALDRAQFAALYGAPDDAVAAVRAFAQNCGLTVVNVDPARRVVELSGTVARMEPAFGTTLSDYRRGDVTYRGREGPLFVPQTLAPYLEAVLGLDNRPVAGPRIAQPRAPVTSSYTPAQLATLYDFPANDGSGQTIALIELGGNYGAADLATYFSGLGLKVPQISTVSVSTGAPVPYGQDATSVGVVMLDVEMVGAIAQGAAIVVYFSDNTDDGFYQAASQAVHDAATTAVSISWGSPEKDWTQQSIASWQSLGQSAIALDVAIFVAAGDHGCADEQPGDPGYDSLQHVDFPGSCDTGVVSCGGTNITTSGTSLTSETVWNDENGWAGGGGISAVFTLPAWQQGISAVAGTPLTMRGVPDVAGDADPDSGIVVRADGSDGVSGGTSAVAPLWAALTARLANALGRKPGFYIPLLYANQSAAATNDITQGNNSVNGIAGFDAKAGWDACTGLGSPNGAKILAVLEKPAS